MNVAANPAIFADWQSITWPNTTDPETIGPDMDPDQDGLSNLLEWALHLNASAPNGFKPTLTLRGAMIEFSYIRRKTAPGEAAFQVLWSDTLGDDWSDENVTQENPVSETATTRTVMVSVPVSADRRFLRVRVTKP